LSFRTTTPSGIELGTDRTVVRIFSPMLRRAFDRGHMYSRRRGCRNSKPRKAKPSDAVVVRLFSAFTWR
jgi:hypothetical protein